MSKNTLGHIAALFAVCVWGLSGEAYSSLRAYLSPLEIILAGIILCFAVLNIVHLPRMKLKKATHELWFVLAGFLGIALYFYLDCMSLSYSSKESVSVLMAFVPLLCSLISGLVLKTGKSGRSFYSGFGISVAGIFLINYFKYGSFVFNLKGVIYSFCAALCIATYFVVIKRIENMGYGTLVLVRRVFFWGIVFLIPLCFMMDFDVSEYMHLTELEVLIKLLFVGVAVTGSCYLSFAYSMRHIGAVKASVYMYASPVISIVAWAFITHSYVSAEVLLGVILTVVGLTVALKR